jgi:hypothetical protein
VTALGTFQLFLRLRKLVFFVLFVPGLDTP